MYRLLPILLLVATTFVATGSSVAGPSMPEAIEFTLSRSDLGYLSLGIVFVAIGLITLFLTILRTASRDAAIFLFGAMSLVWGIRFLFYTGLMPELLGLDPPVLARLARASTYFGAAAAFGFAWAFLGPGWRTTLCKLSVANLVFAMAASLVLVVNPNPDLLLPVFNVLVILGVVTIVGNICHRDLRRQRRLKGLLAGSCIGILFFIMENLRALGVVAIPFDVEWIGVLIIYGTLGRLIAHRLFTSERRLASIRQELETARQIQESILPQRPPSVPGMSLAARYVPMTEVAGDIYDFVAVDEASLCILVADVSGHGVPAALIASMVKAAFRAQTKHADCPDRVLDGMNRFLIGHVEQQFVTAGCAYVDTRKGFLRYAGAGHPPLLIQPNEESDCVVVQQNGLILGQFPEATYTSIERPLHANERLILYTDGILEAANSNDEEFGDQSLRTYLNEHKSLSAEKFADDLLTAVTDWSGFSHDESLADDMTLIVVDVHAGN